MANKRRDDNDDDDGGECVVAEGGLRARFRKRKAQEDGRVEFGVAQANAYFNARRIKRAVRKPTGAAASKKKSSAKPASSGKGQDDEDNDDQDDGRRTQDKVLVLPPRGAMLAALKIADQRESERRAKRAKFALPRFDQHFALWRSQLLANQNLLFYGVGSKLSLLQKFAEQCLEDGIVMQLHGYLPTVSMRYLAKFVHQEVHRRAFRISVNMFLIVFGFHVADLPGSSQDQSLARAAGNKILFILLIFPAYYMTDDQLKLNRYHQCQDIVKLSQRDSRRALPRLYLVVHSIDGVAMRTPEIQTCLSWLATASFVNVVASIDQINGTSLWKEEDSLRFRWISQVVNTCLPYSDEIELRLSKQSKTTDQSSSGIKFILQSLTPTDVVTLQVIAQHQLAAVASASKTTTARRKPDAHADYQKVYDVCRKKLLHATILAMKNSVKCLEEHGLVKLLRVRNVEKLTIPLAEHLIKTEILQLAEDASGAIGEWRKGGDAA